VLLVLPFSDALDLGKYFLVVRAPLEGSASDLLVCEALSGSPWCHCSVFQSIRFSFRVKVLFPPRMDPVLALSLSIRSVLRFFRDSCLRSTLSGGKSLHHSLRAGFYFCSLQASFPPGDSVARWHWSHLSVGDSPFPFFHRCAPIFSA
jgi:hypothetical protein